MPEPLRHLVLVLGDQLDLDSSAFDGFDPARDAAWMAEVAEESTHVWSSQPRIALFLAAMRHFAEALRQRGRPLHYRRLGTEDTATSLAAQLRADLQRLRPARLVLTRPGDWRVLQTLQAAADEAGLPLELREDRHFFTTPADFAAHAQGRRGLRMEFFYREQRQRHGVLMDGPEPLGGQWNYDADNREAFGPEGPGFDLPQPPRFEPDAITREVIALVRDRFGSHPGRLDSFAWPLTRTQALLAMAAFMRERLPLFGPYQDAIWPGEPWLRWPAARASSGRSSAGANTCAASTGPACPATPRPTPSMRTSPCPAGTGPATPTWPACATPSGKRWSMATRTTSSG
jgi:deoxyribodipyrimidine photolyase-related protein